MDALLNDISDGMIMVEDASMTAASMVEDAANIATGNISQTITSVETTVQDAEATVKAAAKVMQDISDEVSAAKTLFNQIVAYLKAENLVPSPRRLRGILMSVGLNSSVNGNPSIFEEIVVTSLTDIELLLRALNIAPNNILYIYLRNARLAGK